MQGPIYGVGRAICSRTGQNRRKIVDFTRSKVCFVLSASVRRVWTLDTYKFLGVALETRLDWSPHTEASTRTAREVYLF